MLPDADGRMASAADLTRNDAEWLLEDASRGSRIRSAASRGPARPASPFVWCTPCLFASRRRSARVRFASCTRWTSPPSIVCLVLRRTPFDDASRRSTTARSDFPIWRKRRWCRAPRDGGDARPDAVPRAVALASATRRVPGCRARGDVSRRLAHPHRVGAPPARQRRPQRRGHDSVGGRTRVVRRRRGRVSRRRGGAHCACSIPRASPRGAPNGGERSIERTRVRSSVRNVRVARPVFVRRRRTRGSLSPSIRALRRRRGSTSKTTTARRTFVFRFRTAAHAERHATLSRGASRTIQAPRATACAVCGGRADARFSSRRRSKRARHREEEGGGQEGGGGGASRGRSRVDIDGASPRRRSPRVRARVRSPRGIEARGGIEARPRTIADDKEWRRSTFASLFGGGNAARAAHVATIRERAGDEPETTDEWVIGAAIGVGRARDMALDRKHANRGAASPRSSRRTAARTARTAGSGSVRAAARAGDGEALAAAAARAVAEGREPPKTRTRDRVCASRADSRRRARTNEVDEARRRRARLFTPARAPAIVSAYFAVSRAEGRTLAGFVEPDADDADVFAATRREWNRAMCACVVTAYATMVTHARLEMTPSLPAEAFYAAWPTSESLALPPPALDAEGRVDGLGGRSQSSGSHPASELFVKPLYRELGEKALFRSLGGGARAETPDGYFRRDGARRDRGAAAGWRVRSPPRSYRDTFP